jgi:DNA-directed RNA polymerase beta' subunit
MNISEGPTSYIGGVEFGFLSDKEIFSLSVTRITNPITFDTLLHPNNGGLYDTALGSFQNGLYVTFPPEIVIKC